MTHAQVSNALGRAHAAHNATRSSDLTLAPLPRYTRDYDLAVRRLALANYHAARSVHYARRAGQSIALGMLDLAGACYDDATWHRAHAAELRADAGDLLKRAQRVGA